MKLYLGVDGGGSKTRAALCDDNGHILARGMGGASNYLTVGVEAATLSLNRAISEALSGYEDQAWTVCIGLAGVGRTADLELIKSALIDASPSLAQAIITHDAHVAWAGATAMRPGIVIISGTGSIAYGVGADGREHRCGGYGPVYSDEGSGYEMGRKAIVHSLRARDGRGAPDEFAQSVCRQLGCETLVDLANKAARNSFSRQDVALLTQSVSSAFVLGNDAAQRIVQEAALSLAELGCAVAGQLDLPSSGNFPVTLTGGAIASVAGLCDAATRHIRATLPSAQVDRGRVSPLGGALLLAMQSAGARVSEVIIKNLSRA